MAKRPGLGSLLMQSDPKKYINLGAVSAFGPSFWLLLGPPLTAYCELLTFLERKKVISVPAAISASKQGPQKVVLLRKSNLNLARISKWWGGGTADTPLVACGDAAVTVLACECGAWPLPAVNRSHSRSTGLVGRRAGGWDEAGRAYRDEKGCLHHARYTREGREQSLRRGMYTLNINV